MAKKKGNPTLDVWKSLGFDRYLRPDVVIKKDASGQMMKDNYE